MICFDYDGKTPSAKWCATRLRMQFNIGLSNV